MALSNLTDDIPPWEGKGLCERFYGSFRSRRDCSKAIGFMPSGELPVPYEVNRGEGPRKLPYNIISGKTPT